MSIKTSLEKIPRFQNSKKKIKNLLDCRGYCPIILQNLIIYPPECISFESLNKNGSKEDEIKSGTNSLNQNIAKAQDNPFKFNHLKNNYINFINNQKIFRAPFKNDNDSRTKMLESTTNKSEHLDTFSQDLNLKGCFYKEYGNEELYKEVFTKTPLISAVFKQKKYEVNHNIYQIPKNMIKKNISKSCEPFLIKSSPIKQKRFSKIINLKKCEINNMEINNQKKINFNIPDNFLIDFNIKKINIKNIQKISNHNYHINLVNLTEVENFINNICKKNINNKDYIYNLNYSNEEYIESQKITKECEKNIFFLQKKRNGSEYNNEFGNINGLDKKKYKNKKNSLKKNNKNKNNKKKMTAKLKKLNRINNRKNGESISLYLNQIEINENSLENFPFYPILDNNENFKIKILKGLTEKENIIRVNKNKKLINDERNLKYIKDKLFEIIYQNNFEDIQYIVHINGYHIIYLIFYYYYHIQEDMKLLNKLHYSHRSNREFIEVKNHLEILIRKCNKLTQEISK
jgi:hypothetical protein